MAFLPIGLAIGELVGRTVGAASGALLLPALFRISDELAELGRSGVFQAGFMKVADAMSGLQYVGLQVFIVNQDLLDNLAATRWATAYLSYVTAIQILEAILALHRDLVAMQDAIIAIGNPLLAYAAASQSILVAMLAELRRTPEIALTVTNTILVASAEIYQVLIQILAALQQGVSQNVHIQVDINAGGLADFFSKLDFWKFLGVLAAIVAFVALLGAALMLFGAESLIGVAAVGAIAGIMYLLARAIASFPVDVLERVGLALLGIVGFVALLGAALRLFSKDSLIGVLAVAGIALVMGLLMKSLSGYDWEKLAQIGTALAMVAAFLFLVGKMLSGYSWDDLKKIGAGLGIIALFMIALGLALRLYNEETMKVVPGILQLFDALMKMAQAIKELGRDDLLKIGAGLLGIVAFVALLGLSMMLFNADVLNALPGLSQLLDTIVRLADTIANMQPGTLVTVGLAFLALAGFMFLLAIALRVAEPGLHALADVLAGIEGIMDRLAAAARALWSVLGPVLQSVGGGFSASLATTISPIAAAVPPAPGGGMAPPGVAPAAGGEGALAGPPTAQTLAAVAGPGPAAPMSVDQSVNVQGGITVQINAERLEADAGKLLSDQIVQQLRERLGALRSEQDFRFGVRSPAPA